MEHDRRRVPMLQRLSEWASIAALLTMVFGGGVFYQKVDAINEQLKVQNAQLTAIALRVTSLEVDVERLKGEDKLHNYLLNSLLSGNGGKHAPPANPKPERLER